MKPKTVIKPSDTYNITIPYDREACELEVTCKNGVFDVLVDYEDADWICENNWRVDDSGYVVRGTRVGTYKLLRLHREILIIHGFLNPVSKIYVDHIDNNKLNNTKKNLRLCRSNGNNKNRRSKRGIKKGITRTKYGYRADICVDGVRIYLGTYNSEQLARKVYNNAGKQLHKEFFNSTEET